MPAHKEGESRTFGPPQRTTRSEQSRFCQLSCEHPEPHTSSHTASVILQTLEIGRVLGPAQGILRSATGRFFFFNQSFLFEEKPDQSPLQ